MPVLEQLFLADIVLPAMPVTEKNRRRFVRDARGNYQVTGNHGPRAIVEAEFLYGELAAILARHAFHFQGRRPRRQFAQQSPQLLTQFNPLRLPGRQRTGRAKGRSDVSLLQPTFRSAGIFISHNQGGMQNL